MMGVIDQMLKPSAVGVDEVNPNRAKITLEPLERGFGHTLGNALRRVLLSSIPGCAIVEVEMDGVLHEYTAVEGLQEDIIEVLLNLKGIALVMHEREEAVLTLSKSGAGPVTAGDIQVDHTIEVVNPDHVICNLTQDGSVNMRLKVERGVGYQAASQVVLGEQESRPIGRLQLDASFCPVRKVAYSVDAARVEQRTNLDKLTLDIETNGTVDCEGAVKLAANILADQLSVFVDFKARQAVEVEEKEQEIDPVLLRPIDDLELTVGTRFFEPTVSVKGFFGFGLGFTPIWSSNGEARCNLQQGDPGWTPDFNGQADWFNKPCLNVDKSLKESDNVSRVNLTWNITDDHMTYFTWSEGYRPGFLNRPGGAVSQDGTHYATNHSDNGEKGGLY